MIIIVVIVVLIIKCIQVAIIIIIVDVISIVAVEEGVGDDVEALGGHECHLRAMLGLGVY